MFQSARIKLTMWYMAIVMLISVGFSIVIYRAFTHEVDRFVQQQRLGMERRLRFSPFQTVIIFDPELIYEIKKRMVTNLAVINGVILMATGVFGYFLAGRTLQPIAGAMEEQDRFVSDASHELKTPLTSLKSAFEVYLMDEKSDLEGAKNLIKESVAEVDKLQTLSESMLQLALDQKPKDTKLLEAVDMKNIVDQAVKKIAHVAGKKNIKLKVSGKTFKVKGISEALIQLTTILLDNAVKYSPEESVIEINMRAGSGGGKLEVTDEGEGIEKKDLPHIFDRFYRADSARRREGTNGYGLGLAIAKKIVDSYGGTIEAKSVLGRGAKFEVTFK